jgi:cyclopropane fatty-acyl-phospholipid synthase-like methyltransferase
MERKMEYRKQIDSTEELAAWYDAKYTEMGDGWETPAEECNRHLDAMGVGFDKSKRLLDVGCGAGHFLAEAEKRVTCFGSEISEIGVKLSSLRAQNSTIVKVSIENTDYWGTAPVLLDYIVSIGSLEHIVDLPRALDNIRLLLKKPEGKFYFYCPNELWKHFDQPNERTMRDEEWMELFEQHGLYVYHKKRWNDNTAFCGGTTMPPTTEFLSPFVTAEFLSPFRLSEHAAKQTLTISEAPYTIQSFIQGRTKLNCGSGQRKFDPAFGWINLDSNPKWEPDVVADWNNLGMFADESMDLVVSHHSLEHAGCGEATGFIREANRILKPGGSLLVFVPDMKALAQRFILGQITEQIYMTNVYGAYMGDEQDRHKWGWSRQGLLDYLKIGAGVKWRDVHAFNWRTIAGADIAAEDWWITAIECVK